MDDRRAEGRALTEGRPPFSRILVGTDGSERSTEAARQGARLAAVFGAGLEIAFVVDTRHAHDTDVGSQADAALEHATDAARSAGLEPDVRVLAGDPAETLVGEALEHRAELICLGPHAGVLGAVRIGRVTAHVLRAAHTSVMLARLAGPGFPERITCGIDGSEASADTARVAAAIAAESGAELHLLHVVPVFRGRDAEWTLEASEPSPPELEASVLAASSHGVVPVRDMAMGRPEHALVTAVRRDASDLLVVGHRGVSGMRRVLLGSVSEHCAEHAPCSVLVVRPERNDPVPRPG
jgi:nucleotide-binding universal stress UspA family protein